MDSHGEGAARPSPSASRREGSVRHGREWGSEQRWLAEQCNRAAMRQEQRNRLLPSPLRCFCFIYKGY